MKNYLQKGFTLVELLIVIALLGIIATIVIAAINPIEQANRANDAGMKADGSQIVSAIQRYYTAHQEYPWEVVDSGTYTSSDIGLDFISAANQLVGLCGANCKTPGELITSNELQSTFLNRNFITTTATDSKLFVGKGDGSSSGVFVCWIPKSQSNRQNLITQGRVINVSSGFSNGLPVVNSSDCTTPSSTNWTKVSGGVPVCGECVPE